MGAPSTDFAQSAPSELLRPYISHYVGFRARDLQPSVHSGLPSRHMCLAIAMEDPLLILRSPGSPNPTASKAVIGGLSTGPTTVAYGNRRDGLFVHLKPGGVFALFGVKPFELSSRTVDLSLLWGNRSNAFVDRLAAECGFHDQAHLTLEWNIMAGCSPKTWIVRELPFFQYPDPSEMDD